MSCTACGRVQHTASSASPAQPRRSSQRVFPWTFADGVSGSSTHTPATALNASQQHHANRTCRTSGANHTLSLLLEAYRAATTAPTGTAGNAAAAAINPSPVACPQTNGSTTAACDPVPAAQRPSPTVAQQPTPFATPAVASSKPTASGTTSSSTTTSSSLSRLGGSKYGHFLQQEVSLTLSQGPSRPGRQKCEPFLDWGYCRYGSGCIYDHPKNHGVFLTPSGLPFRPAEPICPTYLATNTCKFGPACRLHHPSREPRQPVLAAKGTAAVAGASNKTIKDSGHLPPADAAASAVAAVQAATSQATGKDGGPAAAGHNLPSSTAAAAAAAAGKRKLLKAARSHTKVKPSTHSTAGQENVQVPCKDADVSSAVSGNSGNGKASQSQLPTAPGPQLSFGKATGDGCNTGTNSSSTKPLLQQQPGDQPAQAPPARPVDTDATAQGRQQVPTFSSQATAVTVANHKQQQQHNHRSMQPPGARLFQRATAAVQPDAAARAAARAPFSNIQPSGAKPPRPRPARAAVKPVIKRRLHQSLQLQHWTQSTHCMLTTRPTWQHRAQEGPLQVAHTLAVKLTVVQHNKPMAAVVPLSVSSKQLQQQEWCQQQQQ